MLVYVIQFDLEAVVMGEGGKAQIERSDLLGPWVSTHAPPLWRRVELAREEGHLEVPLHG